MKLLLGLILIGLAVYINAWIGKRRFNRRNNAGIEEFEGYWASVRSETAERLAIFIGICAIFSGIPLVIYWLFHSGQFVLIWIISIFISANS